MVRAALGPDGYRRTLEAHPRLIANVTRTPAEVRRQACGRRLAELVLRHREELAPVLLEVIAEEIGALVGRLFADLLAAHKGKGAAGGT